MTGEFYVDPEAVRGAVSELNDIHGSISAGLRSVSGEIDGLLSSGWSGAAADFFRDHYDEFTRHAQHIVEDAEAIAGLVSEAVRDSGSTDEKSAVTISQLKL